MKKQSFDIRPAATKDLEILQQLAYEIWPFYYQTIISIDQIEYMLRLFSNTEYLQTQLNAGMLTFLVFEGDKPIGYMALMPQDTSKLKLDKLYLLPETRGKGYGKNMLEFAENQAKDLGFESLILNVNRFNPSLDFYKKAGFIVVQQVDIPLGPFWLFDFIMEKNL